MKKNRDLEIIKRHASRLIEFIKMKRIEITLAFALGGFISIFVIEYVKVQAYNFDEFIEEVISSSTSFSGLEVTVFESFLLIVSFFLLFAIPFISNAFRRNESKFFLIMLIFFLIFDILFYFEALFQGIDFRFMLFVYISISFYVWVFIEGLKGVYNWCKVSKEEKEHFNIAKLTLIWTIAAFAIGLLLSS